MEEERDDIIAWARSLDAEAAAEDGALPVSAEMAADLAKLLARKKSLDDFHERHDKYEEARQATISVGYWFAVYFKNREQKLAFLEAVNWLAHGET